jgi:hypothetical protein
VLSVWQYLASGYLNPGDALLAAGVEASLRAAREGLLISVADHVSERPGRQLAWTWGARSPGRRAGVRD